ncbi:hypothetical protein BpHYR1_016397 [Brachionus plicatilis]|uniref:Uncharacterized protein n=1 Tax=Brachionus plicatilis TaxID=10195 RepID=A0A3M7SX01_BRAPC|nr:hypothetical protein BpHYR1_016397 [Brachionus plicatilis]
MNFRLNNKFSDLTFVFLCKFSNSMVFLNFSNFSKNYKSFGLFVFINCINFEGDFLMYNGESFRASLNLTVLAKPSKMLKSPLF